MHLPSHAILRISLFFVAAFVGLVAAVSHWSLVRGPELTGRADNPRRVLAERRIKRGPILDRRGEILARTVGQPGDYQREYLAPQAAPVLGYASITYGVAGIEAALDDVLRGEAGVDPVEQWWLYTLLHAPQEGRSVQLTLDSELQSAASLSLAPHAGAVVALEPTTGAVRALVSLPTFDPNTLDEDWDALVRDPTAPLFNRATMGLYHSGQSLLPVYLGIALQAGAEAPAAQSLNLGTVEEMLLAVGATSTEQGLRDFGLLDAPQFALPTAAAAAEGIDGADNDAAAALRVSPLQMALAMAALAGDGARPEARLVAGVETPDGALQPYAAGRRPTTVVALDVAERVRSTLPEFSGDLLGYMASARQPESNQRLGWYAGFTLQRDLVVVVVVEDQPGEIARRVAESVAAAWARFD